MNPTNMNRGIQDYEIIKKLGSGAFGKVYKVKKKSNGEIIALKVIEIPETKPNLAEQTDKELEFLKTLSEDGCNPYVICYKGGFYDKQNNKYFVEMELINGSEMGKFAEELRKNQDNEVLYYYLLLIADKIAEGLQYSHEKGIIHNDIKLSNIMVDDTNIPRIIDYGLACTTGRGMEGYCVSNSGSPSYIPPEFFNKGSKRYPASDLWALGISLYEAATGKYPYNIRPNIPVKELFSIIKNQKPAKLNTSNQQLNNLVNGLLVIEINKRLTSQQVMNMLQDIPEPGKLGLSGGLGLSNDGLGSSNGLGLSDNQPISDLGLSDGLGLSDNHDLGLSGLRSSNNQSNGLRLSNNQSMSMENNLNYKSIAPPSPPSGPAPVPPTEESYPNQPYRQPEGPEPPQPIQPPRPTRLEGSRFNREQLMALILSGSGLV